MCTAASRTPTTTCIRTFDAMTASVRAGCWSCLLALLAVLAAPQSRADTVASLLGNFTINQYCGLKLTRASADIHYVVIYGQLPALRELHNADANGDGVTSQAERDAYVAQLAARIAEQLELRLDGSILPLHALHWVSSLPTEQGGFSLRVDIDFSAALALSGSSHRLELNNRNYAGQMGWHEIVVEAVPGITVFDTNAFATSLTGALHEALQSLPAAGPLDERAVHARLTQDAAPPGAVLLGPRQMGTAPVATSAASAESSWLARATNKLVAAISAPRLQPRVALLALLAALLLGAIHALSPGHGKTIVGAYLIGSRGTPRHAAFLGLTVTVTHTVGVFVLGFATLYASRFIVPERLFPILSLLSALLVLGMGIALLVQRGLALRRMRSPAVPRTAAGNLLEFKPLAPVAARGAAHRYILAQQPLLDGGHWHSHGGGTLHSHLPPGAAGERVGWRSLLALGISGGLVPCPSAMVLLLAAVALNKTAYGMLLVLSFSLGLAMTLTAVGLVFLQARDRFRKPRAGARWPQVLPVLSAVAITVVGLVLCVGAVKSFTP
jgi:nickel/cobalt exporter